MKMGIPTFLSELEGGNAWRRISQICGGLGGQVRIWRYTRYGRLKTGGKVSSLFLQLHPAGLWRKPAGFTGTGFNPDSTLYIPENGHPDTSY